MNDDQSSLDFAASRNQVSFQLLSAMIGLGLLSISVSMFASGAVQSPDPYKIRFVCLGIALVLLGYDLMTSRARIGRRTLRTYKSSAVEAATSRIDFKVLSGVSLLALVVLMFLAIGAYSVWSQFKLNSIKNLAATEANVSEATIVQKFSGRGRYSTRQILIFSPEAQKQEWLFVLPDDFNRLDVGDKIGVYVRPQTLEIIPATLQVDTHLTAALIIPVYILLLFLYFAVFRDRTLRIVHR